MTASERSAALSGAGLQQVFNSVSRSGRAVGSAGGDGAGLEEALEEYRRPLREIMASLQQAKATLAAIHERLERHWGERS